MRWTITYIFILFFLLLPGAYGIGIGVSPPKVDLNMNGADLFLINPNPDNLTFIVTAPKGILLGVTEGTIEGEAILRIPVRSDGTSQGGLITFAIKEDSSLVPGVSVRALATPHEEELFRARKIIDYGSLVGYTSYAFDAIRNMETEKKGLIIMSIEILVGIGLYRIWKK